MSFFEAVGKGRLPLAEGVVALFILLNRYDSLLGKMGVHELALTWSSTSLCLGHSALLGQY